VMLPSQGQNISIGRLRNVSIGRPFAIGERADILHGDLDNGTGKYTRVAVKVLRLTLNDDSAAQQKLRQSLEDQLEIWCALKHPNIVDFLGFSYDVPFPAAIILPYFADGNSLDYIKKYPTADVLHLLHGAARGLEYLHHQNPPIIHADVCACNVLVENGDSRLVDFGLVPALSNRSFTTINVLNRVRWQAPEVFLTEDEDDLPFNLKTDIFSFAMLAIELVTKDRPFNHRKIDTVVIVDITMNKRPHKPVSVLADKLWSLLEKCWAEAPDNRPSISAVCEGLEKLI